jgi:MSHA biogenesis protein MshP
LNEIIVRLSCNKNKAKGSALILSLFIIIVLTFLGVALMRVLSTSSETIAQEIIGTRALMAANSGMQAHLQKLFPLGSTVPTCPVNKTYGLPEVGPDISGLYHCSATATCQSYFTDATTNIEYFRLTSTGECGSGSISIEGSTAVLSSRTIQVEARSL